jgi:hypothetical protein
MDGEAAFKKYGGDDSVRRMIISLIESAQGLAEFQGQGRTTPEFSRQEQFAVKMLHDLAIADGIAEGMRPGLTLWASPASEGAAKRALCTCRRKGYVHPATRLGPILHESIKNCDGGSFNAHLFWSSYLALSHRRVRFEGNRGMHQTTQE